jgi:hypothetical protein
MHEEPKRMSEIILNFKENTSGHSILTLFGEEIFLAQNSKQYVDIVTMVKPNPFTLFTNAALFYINYTSMNLFLT